MSSAVFYVRGASKPLILCEKRDSVLPCLQNYPRLLNYASHWTTRIFQIRVLVTCKQDQLLSLLPTRILPAKVMRWHICQAGSSECLFLQGSLHTFRSDTPQLESMAMPNLSVLLSGRGRFDSSSITLLCSPSLSLRVCYPFRPSDQFSVEEPAKSWISYIIQRRRWKAPHLPFCE